MKNIITTMPISVSDNPKLASWVSPYIAKLIEKHTNLDWAVLSFNMLWQKVEWMDSGTINTRINTFKSQLKNLWISLDNSWEDRNNIDSLLSILDSLRNIWLIKEKKVSVKICDCWTCESLTQAWNFWSKKNIQKNEICSKCWSELKEKIVEWLLYTIRNNNYDIYPKRYEWHINNYKNNYSEILISRERDTWIHYDWYNIDVDFLRSMWLVDLKKKWYIPEIVLTNPSWLYNTYVAMSIYKALDSDSIISIVHPYIWVNSKNGEVNTKWLKHENYSLNNLIKNEQWKIMQILLASWLKWGEDSAKINESSKKIVTRLLDALQLDKDFKEWYKFNMWEVEDLLKKISWKNVINALNGRVGNRIISPEDQKDILNDYIL